MAAYSCNDWLDGKMASADSAMHGGPYSKPPYCSQAQRSIVGRHPLQGVHPGPHLCVIGGVGVLRHGRELEGAVEEVLQRLALPDDGPVAHAHEAAVALWR